MDYGLNVKISLEKPPQLKNAFVFGALNIEFF